MESLQQFLEQLPPGLAYPTLFITTFLENLFPPFPGDTFTVIGAYLVGIGLLNIWFTYIITTAGSISGFLFLYVVGMRYGRSYFYRKNFKYFNRKSMKEVEDLFKRWGVFILVINRFLSGFRAVISLVAGIAEYDWRVVTGLGVLSCILWNGVLIYAGSNIGENWQRIMFWVERYNILIFTTIGIVVLFWSYFHIYLPAKNAIRNNMNGKSDNS